jgi:hypothetical protein
MVSVKRQARVAGLIYFLMGITAPIGLIYVPNKLIVSGDAVATAERIRANESLLRLGIATELFHQVLAVFLVLALYRLFKAVHETHARQLVILGALVSVPIVFVNVINEIAALTLLGAPAFLSVFDRQELDALAYLFLRLHGQGLVIASIFWGLWLFPVAMLVIRSGFIPAFLGILMMIAGVGYLVSSFTSLVLPQYSKTVEGIALILGFGELPIMFWLLIWGARGPRSEAPVLSAATPNPGV